jgi:hypothetical protein
MANDIYNTLVENGYEQCRQLSDGRWIGLYRMMYTVGLFVGLDEYGYSHRYCYDTYSEAKEDVLLWDGKNDPPGNWIKRKGLGTDLSNPNFHKVGEEQ